MGLADRIRGRASAKEAGAREMLPIAGEAYADELRVVLGKQGTRSRPSSPGEAPHKVGGDLVGSIKIEAYPEAGVCYVGPTMFYGAILDKSRPFYEIAAARCRDKMRSILFDD